MSLEYKRTNRRTNGEETYVITMEVTFVEKINADAFYKKLSELYEDETFAEWLIQ